MANNYQPDADSKQARIERERAAARAPGPAPAEKSAAQQQVEQQLADRVAAYKAGSR
jgi:hypothetical protein